MSVKSDHFGNINTCSQWMGECWVFELAIEIPKSPMLLLIEIGGWEQNEPEFSILRSISFMWTKKYYFRYVLLTFFNVNHNFFTFYFAHNS